MPKNDIRETDTDADETTEVVEAPDAVADEWAGEYENGAELFVAKLAGDDFDSEYGDEYDDGTVVVLRRCPRKPTPGWLRQHAHLTELQRTFVLLERYASDKALAIIDSLTEEAFERVFNDWATASGLNTGKSRKSARR